jgi:hypothetical protein
MLDLVPVPYAVNTNMHRATLLTLTGIYLLFISCQVESELKTCPVVENCCVYGDPSQSYVVALIVPDRVRLEQLAENLGISVSRVFLK